MLNWVHEVKFSSMGSIFSLYALLANASIVAIVIDLSFSELLVCVLKGCLLLLVPPSVVIVACSI